MQHPTLRYNTGVGSLLLLALVLLSRISLPGSLLWEDSILNLKFHLQELDIILEALAELGQEQSLLVLKQFM